MEIELTRILRAVRRFWWVVVSAIVAFALVAGIVWSILPKSYTSAVTLLVVPAGSSAIITEGGSTVQTYIELTTSDSVLTPVMEEFEVDTTLEQFRSTIIVTQIPGTGLIRVQVTADDDERASELANAVAASFSLRSENLAIGVLRTQRDDFVFERDQITGQLATVDARIEQLTSGSGELSSEDQSDLEQLQRDRMNLQQRYFLMEDRIRETDNALASTRNPVTVSDVAVPPDKPDGTSVVLVVAAAGVLGALVGSGIMLWLELRDPNLRDERHIRELLGTDSVIGISGNVEPDNVNPSVNLASARIAGLAHNADSSTVLFVFARENERLRALADSMQNSKPMADVKVASSYGVLDTGESVGSSAAGSPAMLLVEVGKTRSDDILEVAELLRDLGVSSLSTTVLHR